MQKTNTDSNSQQQSYSFDFNKDEEQESDFKILKMMSESDSNPSFLSSLDDAFLSRSLAVLSNGYKKNVFTQTQYLIALLRIRRQKQIRRGDKKFIQIFIQEMRKCLEESFRSMQYRQLLEKKKNQKIDQTTNLQTKKVIQRQQNVQDAQKQFQEMQDSKLTLSQTLLVSQNQQYQSDIQTIKRLLNNQIRFSSLDDDFLSRCFSILDKGIQEENISYNQLIQMIVNIRIQKRQRKKRKILMQEKMIRENEQKRQAQIQQKRKRNIRRKKRRQQVAQQLQMPQKKVRQSPQKLKPVEQSFSKKQPSKISKVVSNIKNFFLSFGCNESPHYAQQERTSEQQLMTQQQRASNKSSTN